MKQTIIDPAGVNGYFQIAPGTITESIKSDRGFPIVRGVIQRKEALNQNRRRYPSDILIREDKNYQTLIKERRALGELDHPESSIISLQNVSHNIIQTEWKGNDLIGTIEILPTPSGNILKELLNAGIRLGISSRGLGSVKEIRESDGHPSVVVQDDFELLCYDFVSNPSTHGAWMNPVNENLIQEGVSTKVTKNKFEKIHNIISDIICESTGVCCLDCYTKKDKPCK